MICDDCAGEDGVTTAPDGGDRRASVLVVDDERELADLFAAWLADEYEVEVAYDGDEAIELLDESIDFVVLDRRMPSLPGEAVAEHVREEALDCRIAMVTAVEPDFDVLDMGFDDYVVKPVGQDELLATVERLTERMEFDDRLQEYFALASKKAVMEARTSVPERETSERYRDLEGELARIRAEVEETIDDLDPAEYEALFREVPVSEERASSEETS